MDANLTLIENVTSVNKTDSSKSVDVFDAETIEKKMESSNMKKYKSDESIIETSMKSTEEIVECQKDDTTRNEESEEITTTHEQVNNSKTLTTETKEVSVKEKTEQENLTETKLETNLDNTKDMESIKEYEKEIEKGTNNIEAQNEKGQNTLEQSGESLATDLSKVTENNEEESEEEETREISEDSFPEVVETESKIKEVENVNLEPGEKSEPLKFEQVSDEITNSKKDINNQIEHIISDIDINIKGQEKITQLKEQEMQLLQKQKELTNQIHQQQLLAQKLIAQNQLREQELEVYQRNRQSNECQKQAPFKEAPTQSQEYPRSYAQLINEDHKQMHQGSYDVRERTSESRTVDLRKIFTPATDAPEILPRNRKLYASSSFYSPTLHPTVEDQVELARRISHSLSDISNQKSKGQSMYVNRKKRSVKWVHESCGQDYQQYQAKPLTSPNILPAYSDAGRHRVQLNMHQNQLIEKYSKPCVQVVKSPWEAALHSGSASTAFVEDANNRSQTPLASVALPVNLNQDVLDNGESHESIARMDSQKSPMVSTGPINPQRELAYKPSVAQGWGGINVELPKGLYVPKEIALASYAPPPAQTRNPDFQWSTNDNQSINRYSASNSNDAFNGFPISNSTSGLYSYVPPNQQIYSPSINRKVAPNCTQTGGQCIFSPSPLSFEKLSKFQGSEQIIRADMCNDDLKKQSFHNARNELIASGCGDVDRSSTFVSKPYLAAPHFTAYKPSGLIMSSQSSEKSFNNCARGWSTGPASRFPSKNHVQQNIFYPKVHETAANSLPYSDF